MAPKERSMCPNGIVFAGFLSYSYTVGNAWFPVTRDLF
jgi:hypothetical protein